MPIRHFLILLKSYTMLSDPILLGVASPVSNPLIRTLFCSSQRRGTPVASFISSVPISSGTEFMYRSFRAAVSADFGFHVSSRGHKEYLYFYY